ncbi:MAG TPA: hypothetical protein PLP73_02235 [Candidatus Absconditabacterales bacterium]|nr:hypothetical protein [Candidatus Absconditabacterales bacterium]
MSACQKNTYLEMDFNQAVSIFSQQADYLLNSMEDWGLNGQKGQQISLEVDSENKDILLNSHIDTSGYTDYLADKQDLYSQVSLQFVDKKEKNEINISGHLAYKNIDKEKYINFQDFVVNLGTGNYQNNLLLLISQKLEDKRIFLDLKEKNTSNFYKDFNFLLQTLLASNIFYPTENITYNGFFAYKIKIQPDIIQYISENTSIKIDSFEGLLIINSDSKVELKIENSDIEYNNKPFNIKGNIGNKNGQLNVKTPEKENVVYVLSWSFHKNQYKFNLKQTMNYQDMISLSFNLTNKKLENLIKNTIEGDVEFSNKLIYGTDLEKNIKINIKAKQEITNNSGFLFKKPESYIMLKQILGDSFSLSQILSTEDSFINK